MSQWPYLSVIYSIWVLALQLLHEIVMEIKHNLWAEASPPCKQQVSVRTAAVSRLSAGQRGVGWGWWCPLKSLGSGLSRFLLPCDVLFWAGSSPWPSYRLALCAAVKAETGSSLIYMERGWLCRLLCVASPASWTNFYFRSKAVNI